MNFITNGYVDLGTRYTRPDSLASTITLGTIMRGGPDIIVSSGSVDDPFTGRSRLTPQTVLSRAWPTTDLRNTPRT